MHTDLLYEVTAVEVHIHKTNPPRLHVTSTGNASSGSQTKARLQRRIYVVFPADRIQEYDILKDVPDGPTTDDIKSHTVSDTCEGFRMQLKGVKVYAKSGNMEGKL
jgi:predicted Zn-dependent protease